MVDSTVYSDTALETCDSFCLTFVFSQHRRIITWVLCTWKPFSMIHTTHDADTPSVPWSEDQKTHYASFGSARASKRLPATHVGLRLGRHTSHWTQCSVTKDSHTHGQSLKSTHSHISMQIKRSIKMNQAALEAEETLPPRSARQQWESNTHWFHETEDSKKKRNKTKTMATTRAEMKTAKKTSANAAPLGITPKNLVWSKIVVSTNNHASPSSVEPVRNGYFFCFAFPL